MYLFLTDFVIKLNVPNAACKTCKARLHLLMVSSNDMRYIYANETTKSDYVQCTSTHINSNVFLRILCKNKTFGNVSNFHQYFYLVDICLKQNSKI